MGAGQEPVSKWSSAGHGAFTNSFLRPRTAAGNQRPAAHESGRIKIRLKPCRKPLSIPQSWGAAQMLKKFNNELGERIGALQPLDDLTNWWRDQEQTKFRIEFRST